MFLVRIFSVDFYMNPPIQGLDPMNSDFRGGSINQVPIIRIFGSSETGCKTCLHIHGVFPYIYIPFEGDSENPNAVIYQIAVKLDQAINTALGRASSSTQHIYKIVWVSGIPFYGYHIREHQFLKIYFYNPLIMKKACSLLQSGNILGKMYQVHEAHIPFVLQFMIDYNLHGMNFISFSEVRYRANHETEEADVPPELVLPTSIARVSVCQVEADGLAKHIVNRLEVATGKITKNPGIAALWEDERQRRRNKNESSQISQCISQTRKNIPPTASHDLFRKALKERLESTENSQECSRNSDASVYPAETPKSKDILSASYVEIHSSLNELHSGSNNISIEETIEPDLNNLNAYEFNATFNSSSLNDSDARDLVEILHDLGGNVHTEQDSVLSQMSKHQQESDDENEVDMSMPLAAVTTPTKTILDEEEIRQSSKNAAQKYLGLDSVSDENVAVTEKGNDNNTNEDAKGSQGSLEISACNASYSKNEDLLVDIPCSVPDLGNKTSADEDIVIETDHSVTENELNKVKRKLYFTQAEMNLHATLTEEKLVCRYVPHKCKKEVEVVKNSQNDALNEQLFSALKSNAKKACLNSGSVKLVDSTKKCSTSEHSSEELFFRESQTSTSNKNQSNSLDEKSANEKSICKTTLLSKSEKYDLDKNYVAAEGTSKQNTSLRCGTVYDKNSITEGSIKNNVCQSDQKLHINTEHDIVEKHTNIDLNSLNSVYSYSLGVYKCAGQSAAHSDLFSQDNCHKVAEKTFSQNLSVLEVTPTNKELSVTSCGCNILMPKFNPPSREMIQKSLQEYDIPLNRYQRPFYSDFADVTGEIQVGHNVLKIGNVASDLLEFECRTINQSLQHARKLQLQRVHPAIELTNTKLKSIKLSFCENFDCTVTPCKLPPTRKEVEFWIQAKNLKIKNVQVPKKEKLKLLVPCSPGAKGDSDSGEDCISISPFSPVDSKSELVTENEGKVQETPKSSLNMRKQNTLSSRSQRARCKLQKNTFKVKNSQETCKKELKISNSANKSALRKTLLQSQFISHLVSSSEGANDSGQITGATPNNTHGFLMSLENLQNAKAVSEHQYLTLLVMELHIQTRSDFKPDPQLDSIKAIFYSVFHDVPDATSSSNITGIIAYDFPDSAEKTKIPALQSTETLYDIVYVDSEISLINEFVKFIRIWDPDVFAGYEIELLSWGYLIERGYVLGINVQSLLARTSVKLNLPDDDVNSELKLPGRIILNVWRLMRHEIALQSYTFESVVYHILHKRVPLYSFRDLSFWWSHKNLVCRHKTIDFYVCRVQGILKLFEQLDIIGRTSELARLFGIQFYEVLSRGSQFRVESMMLRLAKPLNYVAVSPSVQQRAKMNAPEFLPLILEPESKLYTDPVIVLDFQSLYPSIIIAYNYCFSTCLGKVENLGQNVPFTFGATQLKVSRTVLKRLWRKNLLNFSPCGVAFVKPKVRQGILPRMLLEILDTRLMVKKSMKQNKDDKILQRVLHCRQLGLKLIANVTYGYTAANFSGRMPAVEVGDSVVSKGREILLRAIKLIENTPCWGAKVVYGDTDSIFVLVHGRSREAAFEIGAEIAEAVTNDNPSPVKLKLEKIFQPCILQTKKRYVGYMYESVEQTEPEFCAKGIETVRRDGCPASSKMLEKSLKILFDTCDMSLVRKYVIRQFTKLLSGRVSLQDLIFAKEYRGASNYRPGACVPVLELTKKWTATDKRSEPRCGERVPYVIINGHPGLPLIKLVRSPRELLADPNLLPNMLYYITRVIIPPLNRCLMLVGADANTWFQSMPRKQMRILTNVTPDSASKKRAISHYFSSTNCPACGQQTQQDICTKCSNRPQETVAILHDKIRLWERSHSEAKLICRSCCGRPTSLDCISLDCPVMFCVTKTNQDIQQVTYVRQILSSAFNLEF